MTAYKLVFLNGWDGSGNKDIVVSTSRGPGAAITVGRNMLAGRTRLKKQYLTLQSLDRIGYGVADTK